MSITTIVTTIITVGITGFIGNYIATLFQKRNNKATMNQKKVDDETKTILNLSKKISESSSNRRFATQELIDGLLSFDINDNKVDDLRKNYREEIKKWNTSLSLFNIDLFSIGLSSISYNLLEGTYYNKNVNDIDLDNDCTPLGIHANFFESHILINEFIHGNNHNKKLLTKASINLNSAFANTRKVVSLLQQESDNKWNDMLNGYTEELTIYNLERANLFILCCAIFNFGSHSLRIKRSGR
ncbi:hypothetical protein [Wohlfahrtiimonas chitiniclastica]|uniref:hypothetical protein n=1 Tax=Wohlfahrtiimonas chitiniclastica TaxID=400946 RepID=UPI0011D0B447|nr:hypothetical protein [Wohlfahrtiimonas chitiniclastica]